jgi:hypothetical protein
MAVTTTLLDNLLVIHDPDSSFVVELGVDSYTYDFIGLVPIAIGATGDDYDVVSFHIDVSSGLPFVGSASFSIFNDVQGIGQPLYNDRPSYGTARVQHICFYSSTLPAWVPSTTLLHEVGHRWGAYVDYRDTPSGPAVGLLHEDWIWKPSNKGVHWGRWFDNQNSSMDYDQAIWTDNGDGTFDRTDYEPTILAHDDQLGYGQLDLYLMGLIAATDVGPIIIVQDPSPTPSELGVAGTPTGPYTPNPSAMTISIDNVVYNESARSPAWLDSQRVLHDLHVVVTKHATVAAMDSGLLAIIDGLRARYTRRFREQTGGRAVIDTSLLRFGAPGLYMKDNSSDTGTTSTSAPFWLSPDLWVRNSDDGVDVPEPTVRGISNWIHVRVRNPSSQPYAGVTVNVYLADFAGTEFLYPGDWHPDALLGTVTLDVPAASGGMEGAAIGRFEWTAGEIPPEVPGSHPCLLAEVIPANLTPSGLHHVWDSSKLAQRNLSFAPTGGGGMGGGMGGGLRSGEPFGFRSDFRVGHALRVEPADALELKFEGPLDDLAVFLDPGELLADLAAEATQLDLRVPLLSRQAGDARRVVELSKSDLIALRGAQTAAKRRAASGLSVLIPQGTRLGLLGSDQPDAHALYALFERDTRVRLYQPCASPARYGIVGAEAVIIDDRVLLRVDSPRVSLRLPLKPGAIAHLGLITMVLDRKLSPGYCHIVERRGDLILGGLSVRLG